MRKDSDFLGEVEISNDVYYGVQTLRAIQNFNISGTTHYEMNEYIQSIALIKKAAALANYDSKALNKEITQAICEACDEIIEGKHSSSFPIDVIQGGGGTSSNMNVNEVVACRANEILTGTKSYSKIHPNTHVNMGQSTNDVIPSAMKIATYKNLEQLLIPLEILEKTLIDRQKKYENILRLGRTCIQDALPMTFGQYFSGYVSFVQRMQKKVKNLLEECLELPLGATAIGTSLSVQPGYLNNVYKYLQSESKIEFKKEENFFDGLQNADLYIEVSATLKRIATTLSKIATDFRILSSGPKAGFQELNLPAVQPGSSIMPGKVNPVIPELVNQLAYQVCGNDMTISMAVEGGELDLNVWEPIIIKNLSESFRLLNNGIRIFSEKCIANLTPNKKISTKYASDTLALSTTISAIFGYKTGTLVARKAFNEEKTIKEVVLELELLSKEETEEVLDPFNMTNEQISSNMILKYQKIYNKVEC
ncbi:aspartate ammonia-lyase [Malaciobacter mytili LMG 24559]|uniref:Aspartate ammonia-lyase n=1 Tax=Malaciobacter mytili LMG 24559 TaxID=1032238 RepID=A0AAX2AI12_9BACT|nr:aspartate ammonia-lyase [Malaciobacter mytili]AXH14620.1 aspartate ammonia-lyase [Malaciobacter mytili LMG 24559]RXK16672.1 aspartate ammonia-lyase [Malaciobacter mytili LMG 24559]